jgi:hypothetical protein
MKTLQLVVLGASIAACGYGSEQAEAHTKTTPEPAVPPASETGLATEDYSYGYWLNGWRRRADDTTPPVLAIETSHYGLMLNIAALDKARFGLLDDDANYQAACEAGDARLAKLKEAELVLEVEVDSECYRARSSGVDAFTKSQVPSGVWMWESGRVAQHYDLRELNLLNDKGERLNCSGDLKLVAWPDSLALTATLTPTIAFADGRVPEGVNGAAHMIIDKDLIYPHEDGLEAETFSLEFWYHEPETLATQNHLQWILGKNANEWAEGCYGFVCKAWNIEFVMNIGGGRENAHSIAVPRNRLGDAPGTWRHLVGTYDGDMMRCYVDGALRGETKIGRKRVSGNGVMRVGKRMDGSGNLPRPQKGIYDEIRFWNRALSLKEIQAHTQNPAAANRDGLTFEETFGKMPGGDEPSEWQNAKVRLALKGDSADWEAEEVVPGVWKRDEKRTLNLHCPVVPGSMHKGNVSGVMTYMNGQTFPFAYDETYGGYVVTIDKLKRPFPGGYVKISDYDEFDIILDGHTAEDTMVPILFKLPNPANITGLVPMLCDRNGAPTGIHVQLSKNWHNGSYLRAYALVPVKLGPSLYKLRIPYGFYGTLPSASHAQLSLVGYGGNQRWDQLALACGGEAITFDVDMSLTDIAACDVRAPLGRTGKGGNTWGWTDAGWGGDWLGIYDTDNRKLTFADMKVAYLAHGPCLTDVLYRGAYGSDRSVMLEARIQLPRTDDYGRTFQKLTYNFERELETANSYLMRRHARSLDRVVAYGNGDGLIAEVRVTGTMKKGDHLIPPTELKGPAPWWVAFPDRAQPPTGYVSMIIRDYTASFGGNPSSNPTLMARIDHMEGDQAKIEAWFVPPPDVKSYQLGDWVKMDTEWAHLVTKADHYGGPNEAYRKHLTENPKSWKTTYREVQENAPEVDVKGGTLLQKLPIVIKATEPTVSVTIQGGIGYVPIRFEGLETADGNVVYEVVDDKEVKLDQSVHGNDYWQTDCDGGIYRMSFNLPVDGKPASRWILKQK